MILISSLMCRLFVFAIGTCGALGMVRAGVPETVIFDSADGTVKLVGYLYLPDAGKWPGPRPAVVMLHGRSGVYSATAKHYDASTLAARTTMWGQFWAARGYVGLYVDTFGPRGYHKGFAAGTNDGSRPPEVNEIRVRPFDAYMGLKYLRTRADVQKDRVFLQGWSNGGSATLSTIAKQTVAMASPTPETGFRAAIAVYPGCGGIAKQYGPGYGTYAPTLLLIGTEDEEVSFSLCEKLATRSKSASNELTFVAYKGATHSYDTPIAKRQSVAANVEASEDTQRRAEAFFGRFLADREAVKPSSN